MFASPLGYCEYAPLDVMTLVYVLVVIGLVFKAYSTGCRHKLLPWLMPCPCLKGIGSYDHDSWRCVANLPIQLPDSGACVVQANSSGSCSSTILPSSTLPSLVCNFCPLVCLQLSHDGHMTQTGLLCSTLPLLHLQFYAAVDSAMHICF